MNFIFWLIISFTFFSRNFYPVIWLSFSIGLLTDLVNGSLVGSTSLYFSLTIFLIYLLRLRFSSSNSIFQALFLVGSDWFFSFLQKEPWSIKYSLTLFFISLACFYLINRIKTRFNDLEVEI